MSDDAPTPSQWLVILRPPRETFPADATDDEITTVRAHFAYLQARLADGTLVLAGRTQEPHNPIGLVILECADRDDAERIVRADPVISEGLFTYELRPYEVALRRSGGNE